MPNTESIKNEIAKLVEKYNTVAEEKRIGKYNEEMTKKPACCRQGFYSAAVSCFGLEY